MTHLTKKINQLKWLQAIGIDYYLSESTINQQKIQISSNIKKKKPTTAPIYSNDLKNRDKKQGDNVLDLSKVKHTNIPTTICNSNSSNHSSIQLARSLANSAGSLEELKTLLMDFNGCDLKKLANKTVFADGNPQSSIMFIGEAPGSNEDAEGIPFCGESGKLLDNVLASINISRKHNAYITNTVFWRPPANRQPTQEEIDICRPFVEKHIALINPKLIVLVGNVAATSLLGKNAGISKIRQEYYLYTNQYLIKPIQTTSIFHPAYLLRQPIQKKTTWYDLIKIHDYINTNIGI
ncbi:MAG: uracil-DNA glycosylase [Rickettsia endosymbiont of Pseudomimeciton antennatum]|nr:uracil-DNA glycosylase [Rickettsia endosymbiont of Pseudomimeciton antennatum]MCC8398316.1 uracil-DNA glycosylase [Rickettsia endosymbiont of Labidopullus appendiculatus]